MNIKIKVAKGASLPKYAQHGDAGLDLTALSKNVIEEGAKTGYIEYGTGICLEIPDGYVGLVYPRSSISNTGLILANSVGVIDSSYRGEIKLRFKYIAGSSYYNIGERIGQLIITPVPKISFEVVEELSETVRGEGGFGSTSKVL